MLNSLRERLAVVQHAIWSHWMTYMFSCGTYDDEGNWIMPREKVEPGDGPFYEFVRR